MRGLPSQAKGGGLKIPSRRGSWVQIPPPALLTNLILSSPLIFLKYSISSLIPSVISSPKTQSSLQNFKSFLSPELSWDELLSRMISYFFRAFRKSSLLISASLRIPRRVPGFNSECRGTTVTIFLPASCFTKVT